MVETNRLGKPIGILGGTFDPVHLGHIQIARHALDRLPIEKVLFIPCYQPALKNEPLASPEARLNMLTLALKASPSFEVDSREVRQGGVSYSVDTLRSLQVNYPMRPLCLILGSDAFAQLNRWREWQQILELAHLVVVHRSCGEESSFYLGMKRLLASCVTKNPRDLFLQQFGRLFFLEIDPIPISATQIRDRMKQKQSIREFVGESVEKYILENDLYR